MNLSNIRIGNGYDVHRLVEGRKLIVGGVDVPHSMGLDGHSDADALAHALCDALLGALGAGDIGAYFPDTDQKWKGISSLLLLKEVMRMCREKGFELANADTVIVAQKPKLASHLPEMKKNIASALDIETRPDKYKSHHNRKARFRRAGRRHRRLCGCLTDKK